MVLYKSNLDKNTMLKFELPSTPGAEVHIPSRLGYGARMKVRSASYKVHIEPQDNGADKMYQTIDPAAAERELVIQSLTDSRTFHNLSQLDEFGNEKQVIIDRFWIDNTMDEVDANLLGQFLMGNFQEELGFSDNDESPEGNDEEQKPKKSTSKEKPDSNPGPTEPKSE